MDCRIIITKNGEVIGNLSIEEANNLIIDHGDITKTEILLYELGNAVGLEKQRLVLDLIDEKKLEESYADDQLEEDVVERTRLDSWRVSGRSAIVVKQGNDKAFDRQEWEKNKKKDLEHRVAHNMPDLDEDERKVIVQNSFEKIKKFNDDRAKLGTDAHKIAEIIFSKSKEIRNVAHAIDMINTLLGSGEIKFESELYKDPNGTIRTETIEYFLKVRSALRARHGEDCEFRTEIPFRVDDLDVSASYSNLTPYVCGTIDLIVVDNKGDVILYDFKSSTNEFGKWPQYKKMATAVQLYTYKKMLEQLGIPLIKEFHTIALTFDIIADSYDPALKSYSYAYNGIKAFDGIHDVPIKREHKLVVDSWFSSRVTPPKPTEYLETEKLMNEALVVSEMDDDIDWIVSQYFTKNSKGEIIPNKAALKDFQFNEFPEGHATRKRGYRYGYKAYGESRVTLCKDVTDLKQKLKESIETITSNGLENSANLARAFAEQYKKANGNIEEIDYDSLSGASKEQRIWMQNEVSHYLTSGDFELNTDDLYLKQGYLLWKHKTLGFTECVIITADPLMQTRRLAKGTTILGKLHEDGHLDKKEVMTASNGNLAMMKFIAFLANSPGTKDWCSKIIDEHGDEQTCKIASIRVINPFGIGTKEIRPNLSYITSNYELLCNNSRYLLKEGKEFKRLGQNLFFNDPQSLALQAVAQCERLVPIYDNFDTSSFSFDYKKVDDVLEFVKKCLDTLINRNGQAHYQNLDNFDESDPTWRAIFYLINIQNALHGHTYIAELGNGKWFNEGLSPTGLMMSAPGMSTSSTLRTFDEINKAYVNEVIQAINKYGQSGKDACIRMYKSLNMDKLLGGHGNGSTYLNLFVTNEGALTTDFELKDPFDASLSIEMRDVIKEFMLLNYRLTLLSQGSKKALEEFSDVQKMEIYKNPEWRRVPLMDAAFSRQLYNHYQQSGNWLETVKYAVVNKWREMGNLYDDVMVDQLKDFQERADWYLRNSYVLDRRCTWNRFSYSMDPAKRYNLLDNFGPERFETNLEVVMDNMLLAFFKEHFSKQYASQLSALRLELAYAKRAGQDVTDIIDVFDMAVRTKFYGESPIPSELHKYFRPLARLKGMFSILQIGGKAVSMLKEIVYGTFIGFSNAVGQGLSGVDASTYWKAYWYVVSQAHKSMKGVSKLNHLQMKYHIANYGLSQVVNQRKFNYLGWRNFGTDTLFLTATSPDFLHRMVVLVAKMMADGTWDAFDLNETAHEGMGELTYDVMKDPRFEKFTRNNPDVNDPEYWQQKALFEQYVQEFNNLGVTGPDGNKLSVERNKTTGNYYLPGPYLQREVDTFKNYADMLYGHYDDESKALVNDTFLGAFWLQYKTFVTAKIERYTMRPGVYNTHLLKQQYVTNENGEKEALYLKTVWEGNEFYRSIIPESKLTPEEKELRKLGTKGNEKGESVTAYVKWEGIPMEGIMQSVGSLSRTIKGILKGDANALAEFKLIWEDPTKRANFIVGLNDLILMGLLGMIGSTLFGMYNDLDFSEAWNNEAAVRQLVRAGNWAENGLYDVFVGAMQDGPITNTISSMFQAPPIMTSIERAWKDSIDLLKGDSSAFEFLTSEVGALRIFDGMAQAANAE